MSKYIIVVSQLHALLFICGVSGWLLIKEKETEARVV